MCLQFVDICTYTSLYFTVYIKINNMYQIIHLPTTIQLYTYYYLYILIIYRKCKIWYNYFFYCTPVRITIFVVEQSKHRQNVQTNKTQKTYKYYKMSIAANKFATKFFPLSIFITYSNFLLFCSHFFFLGQFFKNFVMYCKSITWIHLDQVIHNNFFTSSHIKVKDINRHTQRKKEHDIWN